MMTHDDLTDAERAYVDGSSLREIVALAVLALAALVLVVFVAAGGDMDDSRNGCATPSCEVGNE